MSRPQAYAQSVLREASAILTGFSREYEIQMQVLEACAARFGSFPIDEYWRVFGIQAEDAAAVKRAAGLLYEAIRAVNIPASLIISTLAREPIPVSEKKKQGAFYTDFRLAAFAAGDCEAHIERNSDIADLAAGSGILLAAIAERYYQKFPRNYNRWISGHVFGFDLSENALRGARMALAVHASAVEPVRRMCANWRVCDSLSARNFASRSFDIVIGNPPWGKVKLSRHSFVNHSGARHIYGTEYEDFDSEQFCTDKRDSLEYGRFLKKQYSLLGNAEPDMYMAFLQRAISVLKRGGRLVYIVPAGLIRSQGTEPLRRYLLQSGSELKYYLLDNKARFFEIDSRFKFVVVSQKKARSRRQQCRAFDLSVCTADEAGISPGGAIPFAVDALEEIRPDLTVPECRSAAEKDLFLKICQNGRGWKEAWGADISREVDMTNDREHFHAHRSGIPVIEGRMVQQFRFGAKAYESGSGRSAKWTPSAGKIQPQYFMERDRMHPQLLERTRTFRAGYCDIAGQTNERAMMSAIIPPDVVCGNKVPTIRFPGNGERMHFWVGVTNSFVFDWVLRRVLSTTVNYFLLFSLPMPNIDMECGLARDIIAKSKALSDMGSDFYTGEQMEKLRAELDVCTARAYGLSFEDLELIMEDFPLLDRAQAALPGEKRSTVTRDLLLSLAEEAYGREDRRYTQRYRREKAAGARAYIPAEMAKLCSREKNE